jgi:arylsulfatase A-like enzyme
MLGLAHRGFALYDYHDHIANYLKDSGFKSVLCGVQHVAAHKSTIGYDTIVGTKDKDLFDPVSMEKWDRDNADALCTYLQKTKSEKKPRFVSMGFFSTHRKYPAPDPSVVNADYIHAPFPIADCPETRQDMAGYCQSAHIFDECFGKVVTSLEQNGYFENSIILLTTDHGIAFPQMKCTLYDTGIGVACIVYYPGNHANGTVCDALVSQLDIFPTLCELEGLEKPERLQGVSLLPLLEKKSAAVRKEIFAEINYHAAYEPARCVRTDRYKYIRRYLAYDKPVLSNIDPSLSKTMLLSNGLAEKKGVASEMLFDLLFDPCERINLINDVSYASCAAKMSADLDDWMKKTADPILTYGARIPKPDGAVVNTLSCINPKDLDYEL